MGEFPALQAPKLLRLLCRKPLSYKIERQEGSHRMLVSPDFPPFPFAWHDKQEVPPGLVRKTLCKDVELTESEALAVIHKRRSQWPRRG